MHGNCAIDNPEVTRELVDEVADTIELRRVLLRGLTPEQVHIGSITLDNAEAFRDSDKSADIFEWVCRGFLGAGAYAVTISVIAHVKGK